MHCKTHFNVTIISCCFNTTVVLYTVQFGPTDLKMQDFYFYVSVACSKKKDIASNVSKMIQFSRISIHLF